MDERSVPLDPNGRELRFLSTIPERRGEAESLGFYGHAAVTDTETLIGSRNWGFIETMAAGSFDAAIGRSDARLLMNHDANYVLARQSSGTLRLTVDDQGLVSDADMAPTSYARDLAILLDRRDVTQMSFAFTVAADEWKSVTRTAPDGTSYKIDHRTVTEIGELFDVSAVTYPAYATTDAALASALRSDDPRALGELFARFGITPSTEDDTNDEDEEINLILARHYQTKHNGLRRSM